MSILAHLHPFAQRDQRITPEQEAQLTHTCRKALVQVCLRVDSTPHTATHAGYTITLTGGYAPQIEVRHVTQFTPAFTFDGELHWAASVAPIADVAILIGAIDTATVEVVAEIDRHARAMREVR